MEKDSLKEATCALIEESKLTNRLLRLLVEKAAPIKEREQFTTDEAAFITWWTSLVTCFSDPGPHVPVEKLRAAWDAALAWERTKK